MTPTQSCTLVLQSCNLIYLYRAGAPLTLEVQCKGCTCKPSADAIGQNYSSVGKEERCEGHWTERGKQSQACFLNERANPGYIDIVRLLLSVVTSIPLH